MTMTFDYKQVKKKRLFEDGILLISYIVKFLGPMRKKKMLHVSFSMYASASTNRELLYC